MKNKKIIIISIVIIIILILSLGTYYIFTKEDKDTTLNLLEKQWIENNKNKVIDMGIVNEIPVFNYNGEGLFFDFLNSLEKITNLEFNKISYTIDSKIESPYAFKIVDQVSENDILIYQDNYVLLTKNKVKYSSPNKISNLRIGVLKNDLSGVNTYLSDAINITFKPYENIDNLINYINISESDIDALVLPKNIYLNTILTNQLNIAYNITELTKNYVLSLGDTDRLNDIIIKYYKKWSKENYEKSYNLHFASTYFKANNIDDKAKVQFRSKRYNYGYVKNAPYDLRFNDELYGINKAFVSSFASLANIEINYQEYDSINALIEDFNANKIDFFFDNATNNQYNGDIYNTISVFDEKVSIISDINKKIVINSLNSLKNIEVLTLKNSQIDNYLSKNNIKTKGFDNINELIKNKNKDSVIAVDQIMYDYFSHTGLDKFKVDYQFTLPTEYRFIIRDINNNRIFGQFFDFYLSSIIEKDVISNGYTELLKINEKTVSLEIIALCVSCVIIALGLGYVIYRLVTLRKRKGKILTKEDKLKYIDLLTSLKNRNYLNDNIEKWDESEVYPQAIIIVDLNNIAYINDNYGHSEGDKVIKAAANILITNQIENSEIIRTNGNEFLIYLVGHDEKQVISYIRKLNKEFKELEHGFGAAIGYSMIIDPIKTIDDAINEATLDMRNNKEELNN